MGLMGSSMAAGGCSLAVRESASIGIGGPITVFARPPARSRRVGAEVALMPLFENFERVIFWG